MRRQTLAGWAPAPAPAAKLALALALAAAAAVAPVAWAAGAGQAAEDPRLRVEIDPGTFTVGDRISARIEVSGAAASFAQEPVFPDWKGGWGEAEVLSAGEPAVDPGDNAGTGAGERLYRQELVLTAFRTGEFRLPPVAVTVSGPRGETELATPDDLAFTVGSVLPAGVAERPDEAELQPPEAPRPLPWGSRVWITAALLAILCAAAVLWAALSPRRADRASSAEAPALPPLDELRRALAAARGEGSAPTAHTAVSRALRRYLGRALEFPAVESSTTEIRRRLAHASLPAAAVRRAATVLAACDLVKFARLAATVDEVTTQADAALSAGLEIDGHLALQAAAAAEAAAAKKEAA